MCLRFSYDELQIVPYTKRHDVSGFESTSSELDGFLKEDALKKHIKDLDTLPHPFSLLKNDTNDGFMLCNSNSCFGHEKDFKGVFEVLEKR